MCTTSVYQEAVQKVLSFKKISPFNKIGWCCERGLNSRPLPYQGSALPLSYRSILLSAADFCHITTQIASKQLHFFSHNVEIYAAPPGMPLFQGFFP